MGVDVAYQCRRLALFAQSRLAAVQQHETSCGRRRKVWGCVEVVAGEERGLRNGGGACLPRHRRKRVQPAVAPKKRKRSSRSPSWENRPAKLTKHRLGLKHFQHHHRRSQPELKLAGRGPWSRVPCALRLSGLAKPLSSGREPRPAKADLGGR